MNRKGFAPIAIILIIAGIIAIGGIWYYATLRSATKIGQQPASVVASSTQTNAATSTPLASSSLGATIQAGSCTSTAISGSGNPSKSFQFNGRTLNPGTNTIDGITFTVLPVYDLWQMNRAGENADGDYLGGPQCYAFKDYTFTSSCDLHSPCKINIFKDNNSVAAPEGFGILEYGPISAKTFSYDGRDYFIVHGTENCGTGGCNDDTDVYSNSSSSSDAPFLLWDNSWGWGDGNIGQSSWGDADGGALDFVVGYQGNTFFFPAGGSVVVDPFL
jgi:hypothetical protein